MTRSNMEGQGLAEYALIVTLIALVCVGALTAMGVSVNGFFGAVPGWF